MQEADDVSDFDGEGVYLAACKRPDAADALSVLLSSGFPCKALRAPTGEPPSPGHARTIIYVHRPRPRYYGAFCRIRWSGSHQGRDESRNGPFLFTWEWYANLSI
jgi:hypothetical protein